MDVGAIVRAARGVGRLSQRDLAATAGVPRSTIERIEAGRTQPSIATLESLLAAVGYQLIVRTKKDRDLPVDEKRERLRDRGGRHYPAHLPLAGKPDYFGDGPLWWGWHRIAWYSNRDPVVPDHMYWHPTRGRARPSADRGSASAWDDAT